MDIGMALMMSWKDMIVFKRRRWGIQDMREHDLAYE
jgi:hypothetical protein